MAGEADAFLSRGKFTKLAGSGPYDFQFHEEPKRGLIVAVAGAHPRFKVDSIGSVPAALLAHETLTRFRPARFINAGTAGGFASR